MKYVITGSLGHISKPMVTALVKAGHEVISITSNQDRAKEIEALGAKVAVGSLEDPGFTAGICRCRRGVYHGTPELCCC